jgi:hypothetical protein
MNLKNVLVIALFGTILSTSTMATEFTIEDNGTADHLRSNSANQAHYNFMSESEIDGKTVSLPNVPLLLRVNPKAGEKKAFTTFLSGLLSNECNANLPTSVCQLAPEQVKIFLVMQYTFGEQTREYHPTVEYYPNVALNGIRPEGKLKIVDADSNGLSCSEADGKFTISGFQKNRADTFWSCFEYEAQGQPQAVVGLHCLVSFQQFFVYFDWVAENNKRPMTKVGFLKELQTLQNSKPFKESPHIPKLLSLFSDEYTMGTDAGCPCVLKDFGGAEQTHRWGLGPVSSVELTRDAVAYAMPRRVSFLDTVAALSPGAPEQQIDVCLNGVAVRSYKYTGDSNLHTIDMDIPQGVDRALIELNAPLAVPFPGDGRKLSVRFNKVKFTY